MAKTEMAEHPYLQAVAAIIEAWFEYWDVDDAAHDEAFFALEFAIESAARQYSADEPGHPYLRVLYPIVDAWEAHQSNEEDSQDAYDRTMNKVSETIHTAVDFIAEERKSSRLQLN